MVEQLNLFDYFPNQSSEINSTNDVMAGAGRKKYAYDCGEELKGARKHFSAAKFSKEWREAIEMDPAQAFKLVCKDELLSDFDPKRLRDDGFSSEAAYAVKLMWDRVCQRPDDNAQQREYFIQAVNQLRTILSDARTEEMFRAAIDQLRQYIRNAFLSTLHYKAKSDTELLEYRFWLSLGERFISLFIPKSGRGKPGYHKIFERAFYSDEAKNWAWAEERKRGETKRSENVERWERMVPEEVVRHSIEPSGVNKPEDLINEYGFRGIQFGNWVEDAAGRYHVLCAGNAFADLSSVLGLNRLSVSFYGLLGIAFGARGSGSAAAHFEPATNVINLTKINGGGALCHEWAHALDCNLYSYSHRFTNGKRAFLSGNEPGEFLPAEVSRAFKLLMKAIKSGKGFLRIAVTDPLPRPSGRYVDGVTKSLIDNGYDINKALAALKGRYRINQKTWKDIGIYYCNMLLEEGREVPKEFLIPTDESSFYLDAKRRSAYWKRDHELFARAFEAWIEDELVDRGMTNSYLVSGTRCIDGPYPYGEERLNINQSFRNWWKSILDSGILSEIRLWKNGGHPHG
jgi:hypothetical protein